MAMKEEFFNSALRGIFATPVFLVGCLYGVEPPCILALFENQAPNDVGGGALFFCFFAVPAGTFCFDVDEDFFLFFVGTSLEFTSASSCDATSAPCDA